MTKETLEEKKATGENSVAADATTGAGGTVKNRRADLKKKVSTGKPDEIEDKEKTPQGPNDYGLKEEDEFNLEEAFGAVFEGTELSEEFKDKTLTIFESAVNQRVAALEEEMSEQFEKDLAEQTDEIIDDLVEQVDTYMDRVVDKWLEENRVEIESNIKLEIAESLLGGIKELVSEHNMDIDEEGADALAEAENRISQADEKYNRLFEEHNQLREEKEAIEREIAFFEIAEGLTDTQSDKLYALAEDMKFKSLDDYKRKVETLKENYFAESTVPTKDEAEYLEEEVAETPSAKSMDPTVAAYLKAFDKK